jgi:hypothetical protein
MRHGGYPDLDGRGYRQLLAESGGSSWHTHSPLLLHFRRSDAGIVLPVWVVMQSFA